MTLDDYHGGSLRARGSQPRFWRPQAEGVPHRTLDLARTALMAGVVGPGGSVVAIDAEADLAARARENLASDPQVTVEAADGAAFDPGMCQDAGQRRGHASARAMARPAAQRRAAGIAAHYSAAIASFCQIYSAASLGDAQETDETCLYHTPGACVSRRESL